MRLKLAVSGGIIVSAFELGPDLWLESSLRPTHPQFWLTSMGNVFHRFVTGSPPFLWIIRVAGHPALARSFVNVLTCQRVVQEPLHRWPRSRSVEESVWELFLHRCRVQFRPRRCRLKGHYMPLPFVSTLISPTLRGEPTVSQDSCLIHSTRTLKL
jgi:hypothetical protein